MHQEDTSCSAKLERYTFVPNKNSKVLVEDPQKSKLHALTTLLLIVGKNLGGIKMKAAEVDGGRNFEALLSMVLVEVLLSEPMLNVSLKNLIINLKIKFFY